MSLRALDWDRGGGMLHTLDLAHDHLPLLKGKGAPQDGSYHCHLASMLGWIEDGHVEMQSQDSNGSKSHWQSSYAPHWNGGEVVEDAVTPSKPSGPSSNKEGTLEAVVSETAAAEAPVAPNINYQDDEMASWLQYPLDDSLERNYCSDFFGELPSSNMQVVKESFVGQGVGRLQHMPISNMEGSDAVGNKAASAEAAMALGAGRAAGVIPQTGAEAFSKVRTLQPLVSKWPPHSVTPHSSKGFGVYPTTASQVPPRTSLLASRPLSAPMPPPKPQPRPGTSNLQVESARKLACANFSHFSRSAAIMKNYHQVGVFSGMPSNMLNKQPLAKANVEASTSTGSSIAESTTTGRSGMDSQKDIEIHLQGSNSQQQQNPGVDSSRGAVPPIPVTREEVEPLVVEGEAVVCNTKPATAEQDTFRMSRVTGSTSLESADKGTPQQGRQVPDAQEPTIASSSGGSGNSAERTKEASTSNKRKAAVAEEIECQSEVSI
jgi:phytochrome-interacting factor 3